VGTDSSSFGNWIFFATSSVNITYKIGIQCTDVGYVLMKQASVQFDTLQYFQMLNISVYYDLLTGHQPVIQWMISYFIVQVLQCGQVSETWKLVVHGGHMTP